MKKILFVFLLIANPVFAQDTLQWPKDFLDFYQKFRLAVIEQNYADITEMTCFPFAAFDSRETLGAVSYKKKERMVGKKTFIKYELAKYFLTQAGDITSGTPVIVNGRTTELVYLYENNAQLIAQNDNPQSLKKLRPDRSGYDAKAGTVFISSMEFSKKKDEWCWSFASYMRDEKDKW